MEFSLTFRERLKEALQQSGLKQKEIGDLIGVSQSCVAHYISGDAVPTLETFAKLCRKLDLDANYLLGVKF